MGDVEQLFADWAEAFRRKDADGVAAMVTEDEFWTLALARGTTNRES